MKMYPKLILIMLFITSILFVFTNIFILNLKEADSREYRVEIQRLSNLIEIGHSNQIDFNELNYVTEIIILDSSTNESFFEETNDEYMIKRISNQLYRFNYRIEDRAHLSQILICMNGILLIFSGFTFFLILYIKRQILGPFEKIKEYPLQIARGILVSPLLENKNRYFGKFIWGLNLLRENLEQQKKDALKQEKEEKTFLLSVMHDLKTPLSIIKLYSKALQKNLFLEEKKRDEISVQIEKNVDIIEEFIAHLYQNFGSVFTNLAIKLKEIYLSDIINHIWKYYQEKLKLLKIDFSIAEYQDCFILGEMNRLIEVFQNIIENAIKYGDGKSIRLSIREEENYKLITIENSGSNLNEHELPHIFDSFWRGTNAGNQPGSGLGLYISKQLLLKMEGNIYAEQSEEIVRIIIVLKLI